LIEIDYEQQDFVFYFINRLQNRLVFSKGTVDDIVDGRSEKIELPLSVIEPIRIDIINNKIFTIFKNAILINDKNLDVIAFEHIPISETNQFPELSLQNENFLLREQRGTLVLDIKKNKFWILYKYSDLALKFILPIILFIIIIITIQMYRHQKRIFSELLDLPSAGIIMEFDASGRLIRANTKALDFIKFHRGMPKRKLFSYYLSDKRNEEILDFINSALQNKTDINEKIEISLEGSLKEWLCSAITLRNLAGMFRGIVFTAIDITEQLERKRLTNWAQLAHDMQTNLSTIRLNAENLDDNIENNVSRRKKILHQVNVIMQRVRDIVTVGRSNELERINASAADICISARSEFDETVFPDVSFDLKLEYFSFYCDNKKLIRAVRNAIENAIKALPGKKGTITVSCKKEGSNALFSIKDSGVGMDEKTRKKMMQPYFTTAENKGGFGIGTMIMQHVAEMHGGKIEVYSKENIGTEVIFKIPIINDK
jgi:signal transduction histidine kinase